MVMSNTFSLKLRLFLATTLLVAIVLGLVILITSFLNIGSPFIFVFFAIILVFVQYLIGPEDGGNNNARELRVRAGSTEFTCNG